MTKYGEISNWDVPNVTRMFCMFKNRNLLQPAAQQVERVSMFYKVCLMAHNPSTNRSTIGTMSNVWYMEGMAGGTQALVSFAPLAFKLFYAARQNAVLRRSSFPPP